MIQPSLGFILGLARKYFHFTWNWVNFYVTEYDRFKFKWDYFILILAKSNRLFFASHNLYYQLLDNMIYTVFTHIFILNDHNLLLNMDGF